MCFRLLSSPFYCPIKISISHFTHQFKAPLAVCLSTHLWCVKASALHEVIFWLFVLFYWDFGSVCVFNWLRQSPHILLLLLSHTLINTHPCPCPRLTCQQHSLMSLSRILEQVLARVWFRFCTTTQISSSYSYQLTKYMNCFCRFPSALSRLAVI